MNFASWVILAIVIAIIALAIRSVFFKKNRGTSCHGGSEGARKDSCNCSSCEDCSVANCALVPRIIEDDTSKAE